MSLSIIISTTYECCHKTVYSTINFCYKMLVLVEVLKIVFKNHSNVLILALSTTPYRGTRTHTHFLTASSPAMYSGTFKSTFAPNMILSYILSLAIYNTVDKCSFPVHLC